MIARCIVLVTSQPKARPLSLSFHPQWLSVRLCVVGESLDPCQSVFDGHRRAQGAVRKSHKGNGDAATSYSPPVAEHWGLREGRGHVAILPGFGPFLMLSRC